MYRDVQNEVDDEGHAKHISSAVAETEVVEDVGTGTLRGRRRRMKKKKKKKKKKRTTH